MSEPDETKVTSEENKERILEDKKKLLEIYVIVSGLIIASIQNTSTLIAINTSINETIYKDTVSFTKAIIGTSNLVFLLFIFLILIYYTKTFDDNLQFTAFLVTLISIFFSYILTNFVYLQVRLTLITYFILFALISLAMLLSLVQNSILMEELNKRTLKSNYYNLIILKIEKLKPLILKIILLAITIYVLYYMSIPIFFWQTK